MILDTDKRVQIPYYMASKKNNNSLQSFVGISVGVFLFSVLVYSFLGLKNCFVS